MYLHQIKAILLGISDFSIYFYAVLKKGLTYILIAVLIFNMMAYQCIYVYFKAHQKYIAATLCVKREVKGNNCQGKCQLKKMSKATEAATQKMLEELKVDFICHSVALFEILKPSYGRKDNQTSFSVPSLNSGYLQVADAPPDHI
jgi:hypothetical protein